MFGIGGLPQKDSLSVFQMLAEYIICFKNIDNYISFFPLNLLKFSFTIFLPSGLEQNKVLTISVTSNNSFFLSKSYFPL